MLVQARGLVNFHQISAYQDQFVDSLITTCRRSFSGRDPFYFELGHLGVLGDSGS